MDENKLSKEKKMKKRFWMKKKIILPLMVLLAFAVSCIWYVNDDYDSHVTVEQFYRDTVVPPIKIREGIYLNGPGEENALVFYPGAKVEYTSYLPLCYELAEKGIDCFLVKMPCNLAILGQNKAQKLMEDYTYEKWYVCGHSLGGAMAASYTANHLDEINGLILLAAYPTKPLDSAELSILSVYGSKDGVLNMQKLEEGRKLMPDDYTEICIEGGNHAYFGDYGEQKGDGIAGITREEQIQQTVDAMMQMIGD